ncbi:MAG: 2'-5' RNA ligase family protein [Sphaerochaetaceae bacterium]|nr:2'-5' RNA ligase family protein [Sphaerochaetaceae bacterium]
MNRNLSYTHFIGVLPPEDISLILQDCRTYMNRTYGCKSGHRTPLHVTLIPPFVFDSTEDLISVLNTIYFKEFTARIDNFRCFGERTIYARVIEDKKWLFLRDQVFDAVCAAFPSVLKKDNRPFRPHITVANRDIPQGCLCKALGKLENVSLKESFSVNNITLFEFKEGRWTAVFSKSSLN